MWGRARIYRALCSTMPASTSYTTRTSATSVWSCIHQLYRCCLGYYADTWNPPAYSWLYFSRSVASTPPAVMLWRVLKEQPGGFVLPCTVHVRRSWKFNYVSAYIGHVFLALRSAFIFVNVMQIDCCWLTLMFVTWCFFAPFPPPHLPWKHGCVYNRRDLHEELNWTYTVLTLRGQYHLQNTITHLHVSNESTLCDILISKQF